MKKLKEVFKPIGKNDAAEVIENASNELFIVSVKKKNGEIRTMTCRHNPLGIEGATEKEPSKLGYLTVWDTDKRGWRTINLQEVRTVQTSKDLFKVTA